MIRGYAWILAGTLALFGAGARQPPAQPGEEITVQHAAPRIQQAAGTRAARGCQTPDFDAPAQRSRRVF